MAQTSQQAKLCPHCANSIASDAVKCPYCKAQLSGASAPQWAERRDVSADATPLRSVNGTGGQFKIIAVAVAIMLAATGAFLFSHWPRNERLTGAADNSSELRDKDQKIQSLEAELAKLREGNQGSAGQLDEFKAKLSESQKDLAETERKLADANRELDRLQSGRAGSMSRSVPRGNEPAPPMPPAPSPGRRAAEPGVYETVRATTVFEEPTGSSRALTQITKGTRVTVVRGMGEWLEVRSKHDNPPGFIRADDAMFVGKAN